MQICTFRYYRTAESFKTSATTVTLWPIIVVTRKYSGGESENVVDADAKFEGGIGGSLWGGTYLY